MPRAWAGQNGVAGGRAALAGAAVLLVLAAAGLAGADDAAPALPGDRAAPGLMLEEPPRYGVWYDRREPSFYTGFAPRTHDPRRVHVHLGRGNQLRVTVVLADDVLQEYARDLHARRRTVRDLVASGRLVLTQNRAFEDFEARLDAVALDRLVAEEAALAPDALRARNLALLERLDPGRVHRIRIPLAALVRRFAAGLRPEDRTRMDARRRLEVAHLLLPTRLFVPALDAPAAAALDALVRRTPGPDADDVALAAVVPDYAALLARLSGGIYPVRDGALAFEELTAVYPVGTVAQYTRYQGRTIPLYPTPGRRAFTFHQRSRTVDHVPTDESYAYSPWLPYMHVGPRMHNSIHTPWWHMAVRDAPFLPAAWRELAHERRDGEGPYPYLWLLSRGPMSHGCTHLNVGHIAELRQILPSAPDQLAAVDAFLAQSHQYDVFDVEGDLAPEVVGVRYFIAYSLHAKRAQRLRVRNERRAFYDWLYGGELRWQGDEGRIPVARDARFDGRSAVDGVTWYDLPLWEAPYQPETVQFYRLVDIPFARELRKVSLRHPFRAPPDPRRDAAVGRGRLVRRPAAHAGSTLTDAR